MKTNYIITLLLLCCICTKAVPVSTGTVKIRVQSKAFPAQKFMKLKYWTEITSFTKREFEPEKKTLTANWEDESFNFEINADADFFYISLGWEKNEKDPYDLALTSVYLLMAEKGDDVIIHLDSLSKHSSVDVKGAGSEKFECLLNLDRSYRTDYRYWWKNDGLRLGETTLAQTLYKANILLEFMLEKQFAILDSYKQMLSPKLYEQIKLDIVAKSLNQLNYGIYSSVLTRSGAKQLFDSERVAQSDSIRHFIKERDKLAKDFSPQSLLRSALYTEYTLAYVKNHSFLDQKPIEDEILVFAPHLIDRVLLCYYLNYASNLSVADKDKLFSFGLNVMKEQKYRNLLKILHERSSKGAPLPNFRLQDVDGNWVSLEDFRGKVVFVDFWYYGCAGCAGYYRTVLSEVEKIFEENDEVVFLTISIDKEEADWKRGIESEHYTSDKVINLRTEDWKNEPIIKHFGMISFPYPVLIDRNGRLFSNSSNELRHNGINGLVSTINRAITIE